MVQLACKPVEVVAVRTASPAFCAVTITSVLLYPFCTLIASLLELKETVPISAFAGATDSLMFCGCPTVRLSLLCAKTMLGLFSSAPEAVTVTLQVALYFPSEEATVISALPALIPLISAFVSLPDT